MVYQGASEGRSVEQETWRKRRAQVTAYAHVLPDDDDHVVRRRRVQPSCGRWPVPAPVAAGVTAVATGTASWVSRLAPDRLDHLGVLGPLAGWLADDIDLTALPLARVLH